jgi:hypothetical protein
MRSPIFYDNDNTTYFGDFAGISSMYGVAIRGDQSSTDTSNQIFFWGSGNTTTSAIGFKASGGNFVNPTGNGDGYNTYFTMDSDGRGWVFRRGTGGSNFTSAYTAGWILNNGIWQANASMRAPIFFDSNDTGFSVDPAGDSRMNSIYMNRWRVASSDGDRQNDAPWYGFGPSNQAGWNSPGMGQLAYYWGLRLRSVSSFLDIDGANGYGNGWAYLSSNLAVAGQVRGSIFYDVSDTGYFLDPASTATSLRVQGGIKQRNLIGRPYAVWGAGGSATGAVIIKFPGGTGNYGMIHAVVDIYEYNGNHACSVIVGGHNWNGQWYNFGATLVGYTDKQVRLGVKDGRYCIVIGTGSSSWSYGQVVLRKIQNGAYYDGVMDVAEGYSAAIESDTYSSITGDLRVLRSNIHQSVDYAQAPIFYDSNSAYFGDFSSEIRMPYANGGTMRLRTNTHWDSQSGIDLIGGSGEFRMSSDTGNLNLRIDGWLIAYDYVQGLGAMYSPIYYDSDNSGYYANPAGYSNFNEGNFAGRVWYSNYLVSRNSGGMMGDYNVNGTSSKVIWTIGESWPIGNMYGLGYEYGSGYDHHLALRNNGTTYSRFGFAGGAFIGGNLTLGSDLYAYRFYDRDNTGYYDDPAGTSRRNYDVTNKIKLVNNVNNEPRWDFSAYVVEAQHWYGNNSSMTMYMGEGSNTIQVPGSGGIRPVIIYDYNNAGYYLNMDGTSNLYAFTDYTRRGALNLGRERGNRRDITSDQNHWTGTNGWGTSYGTWASAWEGGFSGWDIWGGGTDHPQGGGYVHAQGIVSGQHYATGGGGTAYGWMMVGAHDAGSRWWLRGKWGGSTYPWYEIMLYDRNIGGGAFYAGIWYDGNNTGYYVDPNGSTQLRTVYADDWFRAQGCAGFYFQSYGRGLWSPECEGNPYGHVATNGGGRNGWGGYGIFSRYTLMSTGGDNMGMHDTARGWIWYMEGGRLQMHWAGNRRMVTESHGVYFDADVRTSILYDHNTSFYFNGDGDSRWNGLDDYSKMRIGLTGRGNFRRNDYTGDTAYWVGSMGWGTTDMNTVASWGSGFIDSWSNPGNQPSGTSHWVGTQAFHYAYGGNSNTGWQLVGGPISNLRFRNAWGGWSGWTTIAMHDRNDGSGGWLYAGGYYDANNSGYYLDPNGTSNLWEVYSYSYRGNGNVGGTGNASWHPNGIYSAGYNWLYGGMNGGGGSATNFGDVRANIFYDNQNTGYYLDPNGTSQLAYVMANDWFRPQGCTGVYWNSYGRGMWMPECEGNPYGNITTYAGGRNGWQGWGIQSRYTFMSTGGDNVGLHDSARGWIWYMSGAELQMYYAGSRRMVTTGWGVYVDQYLEAGSSLRAPIFYDNQDTGYYLDPHNTDDQGLRIRGGTLHGPNWWWGAYLRVGTNSRVDSWASMFTSNGNLHIDSRNGYPMYLNWHNGNVIYVENSIEAQIFYDRNDTGYYFGSGNGDGRFRYTNTNGGFSQSNNQFQFNVNRGYYMNDTANLQAYSEGNNSAFLSWHKTGVFATNMGLDGDNWIRIGGWSMSSNRWQLNASGDMFAAGNVVAYSSDERLKENITTIPNALSMLKELRGVYFDWKEMVDSLGFNPIDRHDIGVIAQEVEKVIPQAIKPAPFDALGDGKSISGEHYKTVQLEKIVPVLIQSVKEQQEIIEKQSSEIEKLKKIVYDFINK